MSNAELATDQMPCQATDTGAANLLAQWFGNDIQYGIGVGWLEWTGCRWVPNEAAGVQYVQKMVRRMYAIVVKMQDASARQTLAEFAASCESAHRIRAIVYLAQHHPRLCIGMECFDSDPMLFNCQNGTLDLRTDELHQHRREDRITNISPIVFDSNATCPLWEEALKVWLPNPQEIECAQIAAGYSFTGLVDEEKFFCLFGPEASGKTTFVEGVKMVAGNYARTSDFETFLKKKHANGGGARGDIARLKGARIVTSSETNDGTELGAGLIKNITGKETITARHMYKQEFEFMPTFKLWLVANHPPYIDPDDGAMWRRLIRLPFVHSIPADQRDPAVKRRLLDPVESGPGILNWIVAGVRKWQEFGLLVPPSVVESGEELRAEMDSSGEFFEDRLMFGGSFQTPSSAIREAYTLWADTASIPHSRRLGPKGISKKLKTRNCQQSRDDIGNRIWTGVMLQ